MVLTQCSHNGTNDQPGRTKKRMNETSESESDIFTEDLTSFYYLFFRFNFLAWPVLGSGLLGKRFNGPWPCFLSLHNYPREGGGRELRHGVNELANAYAIRVMWDIVANQLNST